MAGRRRPSAAAVSVLVAALALAGCADDPGNERPPPEPDDAPPAPGPDGEGPGGDPYGSRPVWFLGLQYEFEVTYTRPGISGPLSLTVVREDEGAFYLTPQAEPDLLYWAMVTHMPPVGTVQKETLHPNIHDVFVPWFDFPLTDGKTWSAPDHHGTAVNYTAAATTTTVPDGRSVPGYEVAGERGGVVWVRYTYTAEIGFITEAELDGNTDGTVDAIVRMTDARVTQDHLALDSFEVFELATHFRVGVQSLPESPTEFTVPEDAVWLYVFFLFQGGPGQYQARIQLPGDGLLPWDDAVEYNWTNTDQGASIHTAGGVFNATAGDGAVGAVIFADGSIFGEVMGVRARPPDA